MILKLLTLCLLLFSLPLSAEEKTEAFLLKVYDSHVKVVSPDKAYSVMSIIVENKTIMRLFGKVVKNNIDLTHLSIAANKSSSVTVKYNKEEKLTFVPLSPAGQEIELIVGKKTYEIPPQK